MYLIAVAVNLAFPCGPEYATGTIQRSLVQIAAGSSDSIAPVGSGFVVSSDGYIMTSRRVVVDGVTGLPQPRILAKLPDGLVVQAHLLGVDEQLDLAMVRVDGVLDLRPVTWGDVANCVVGQPLVAAGFQPTGDGRFAGSPTYASGTISALRNLGGTDYVEHNADISPGLSGGPLTTMCGQVVGVNTQPGSFGGQSAPGASVAVASSAAEAKAVEWIGQK